MEENIRTQEEISLGDIFRILLRKIKVLVLALVIGAVVGAGFGVVRTYNVKYYGTTMQFYVTPKKDSASVTSDSQYGVYGAYSSLVMDAITKLLGSESFAEELMLDEDGIPLASVLPTGENREVIDEAIAEAQAPIAKAKEATEAADAARLATAEAQVAYNSAKSDYDKLIGSNMTTEIELAGAALTAATTALENAEDAQAAAELKEEDAWEDANEKLETVWTEWRKSTVYRNYVQTIVSSVSYSYYDESEADNTTNLAKSFIYVSIDVLNNEGFANFLFERINVVLPEYVEAKMTVPSGYVGTNCQRITRLDEVARTNEGNMASTALKYGLILGAAALIVACVVVIVVDRSNKKLRDYEMTMEKFKVPVLGVIPTIEEREYGVKSAAENTDAEVRK